MIYLIIFLAVISRFLPHMPNFAPITALAIFSAANMDWKKSVGLTLAVRFISDCFLGFFAWPLMVAVYAAHLAGILFGLWIKKSEKYHALKITASALSASAVFFLVTNFAWLYRNYPHTMGGIAESYVNALPFLRGTLLGDLSYTVLMFGALALAKQLSKTKQAYA